MAELPSDLRNLESRLEGCSVLRRVVCFSEIESTSEHLKALARAGEEEGMVVIADHQTAGHGRHGRSWYSPPGVNLYLSVLLRPSIEPSKAPLLSLFAAVCVAESVRAVCGIRAGIKWPNDILLRGKKCSGILVDMEGGSRGVDWVVVGIGLNVNGRDWPEEIRPTATSLAEQSGRRFDRGVVGSTLIGRMDSEYVKALGDGFASVREKWLAYDMLSGERIRLTERGTVTEGVVIGYDDLGAIILGDEDGSRRKVFSGEAERVARV
ncbi:MAG: biotin--[acetyl-CoA-carboxylase] ligase [Nitrospirae bacterium]|nr:biotin--[acetyl-CoA-carboxylase] ligase [Nitrospirota bacterium]